VKRRIIRTRLERLKMIMRWPARITVVALTALLVACASGEQRAPAAAEKSVPAPTAARLWTGTLRTGIVAVGGETTGIVLETPEGRVELQSATDAIRAQLQGLNGKSVTVRGTLTVRAGVEVRERRIVLVTDIVTR
jgi:hypothetical protein